MTKQYDYIIAGAGCAGLSLLYRMMSHKFFHDKTILVVDASEKKLNDRTWCFWEERDGVFEHLVSHSWNAFDFYSDRYSRRMDIAPYRYKMIRSVDLYDAVLGEAAWRDNVEIVHARVEKIGEEDETPFLVAGDGMYRGSLLFNSIPTQSVPAGGRYSLLQHFKGWLIQTKEPRFDDRVATFMDFRIRQEHGTSFAYVLPVAADKALVEYTLISRCLLNGNEYDEGLRRYMQEVMELEDYAILEEEFGVIPMTDARYSDLYACVVQIGTAGGQTKPSSGFTFSFIQKHCDAIIEAVVAGTPLKRRRSGRFNVYDNVLLNVLYNDKLAADRIFGDLFRRNPAARVLRFLDNDSNLIEDLQIMRSVPTGVFLPAAIQEMIRVK